ncbi:MAG: hypothetical protein N3G75_09220 [Methanothrix sp.]|nr:hypothetical protein [Methanothrix sp.]MCX8207987.1 hypothetical protein [Methanothrix sp.]
MSNPKSPLRSKINIIALLGIALPYINAYLSEALGAPVVIEPEMAYNVILGAIIVIRTLWTDAKLRF